MEVIAPGSIAFVITVKVVYIPVDNTDKSREKQGEFFDQNLTLQPCVTYYRH